MEDVKGEVGHGVLLEVPVVDDLGRDDGALVLMAAGAEIPEPGLLINPIPPTHRPR